MNGKPNYLPANFMIEKDLEDVFYIKTNLNNKTDKLVTFINRLEKIGINVTIWNNYPWVYIDTINGIKVKEKYMSDHQFTIAFHPIRPNGELKFVDTKEIFRLIRKYIK